MKKMITGMLVVVFSFSLAGAALAGGVKVPKEVCFELTTEPGVLFCLSTKASGKIKFADNEKVQYYGIDGSFYLDGMHYPIGGTGYINGNLFRFHVSGQFSGMGATHHSINGFVDLSLEPAAGSVAIIFSDEMGGVRQSGYDIEVVPCSELNASPIPILSVPGSEPAGQAQYSR